jgi:CMP-N,N'-diacetyllegionaminic acid synthase
MNKILGIIPARGGSKGIPDKHIRPLAGKSVLAYAQASAEQSGMIDRLILSTDSEKISDLAKEINLDVPFLRPKALAQDESPMLPVLVHAVTEIEKEGWSPEMIILLQASAPLRKASHIVKAIELLRESQADSVVSVIEIPHLFAPQKALRLEEGSLKFWLEDGKAITRRQQLAPSYAREGTVYAFWRRTLMEMGSIYGDRCLPLILSAEESLTLDHESDWNKAEKLLAKPGSLAQ